MEQLPAGTVTFLFTDIEGSTRLLQQLGDGWATVIGDHNRILRGAIEAGHGREVDRQGDAFFAVFGRARQGVEAAALAQRRLGEHDWPAGVQVRVRMGLHTGEPTVGDEGYLGLDVVRAARIAAAARGGQVLVSQTTAALVGGHVDGIEVLDVGEHALKDLERPERLFALAIPGVAAELTPPPKVGGTEPAPLAPVRRDDKPPAAPTQPQPTGARSLPNEWRGHERDLAERALEAARKLDLSELDQLGPRIERQVDEWLRRAGLPAQSRDGAAKADENELPSGLGQLALYSAIGTAILVVAVGAVVFLLIRFA